MTVRNAVMLIALLVGAPKPAVAQQAGQDSTCVFDTVATSIDTVRLVAGTPDQFDPWETDAEFAFRVAQAKRVAPFLGQLLADSLVDIESGIGQAGVDSMVAPMWGLGRLWYQVNDSGHLSGLRVDPSRGDSAMNLLLGRAVLAADSAGALLPLPPPLAHDPIDLWLTLTTAPAAFENIVVDSAVGRGRYRWDQIARPGYRGPTSVPPSFVSGPDLEYPKSLEGTGVAEQVVVQFVVRRDGSVDPATVRVISAHYREFVAATVNFLKLARFRPGRFLGCPASIKVEQTFTFTVPN